MSRLSLARFHWHASGLHVPIAAQRLEPSTAFLVLCPAGPLGDVHKLSGLELHDDVVHVGCAGFDGVRAGIATQRAITLTLALVVVQRNRGDLLPTDVLPNVELSPIQQ